MSNLSQNPAPPRPFIKLGSIVVLKSHPFFDYSHASGVHMAGYVANVPPMMVVIEAVLEKIEATDPEHGRYQEHQSYQYLCVWYSAKRCAFEQNWFSDKVIREVEGYTDLKRLNEVESSWKIGDTVTLITSTCEADKVQVSKKWRDGELADHGDIKSLLVHVCPPLTIIGSCANKAQEPLIDSKTGMTKRWRANRFIKVKYYNEKEDKFSEHLLPESCLTILASVSQVLIKTILEQIDNGSFIWIRDLEERDIISIGIPKAINYISGQYFLLVKCYLTNAMVRVELIESMKIEALNRYSKEANYESVRRGYLSVLPDFKKGKNRVDITHSNEAEAIQFLYDEYKNHPWRIVYTSYDNKTSQRTILPFDMLSSGEKIVIRNNNEYSLTSEVKEKEVKMIHAYCLSSEKAEIYFSTARITQLQVLPITMVKRENGIEVSRSGDLKWKSIWPTNKPFD